MTQGAALVKRVTRALQSHRSAVEATEPTQEQVQAAQAGVLSAFEEYLAWVQTRPRTASRTDLLHDVIRRFREEDDRCAEVRHVAVAITGRLVVVDGPSHVEGGTLERANRATEAAMEGLDAWMRDHDLVLLDGQLATSETSAPD